MPPTDLFGLLAQFPANLGDPQGMRVKAARLDRVSAAVDGLDRDLARAASRTAHYRGPAADGFHQTITVRHRQLQAVIGRLTDTRQRLQRASAAMEAAEGEITAIRRRVESDFDRLGADADRLVRDAQRLVRDLGSL